MRAEWVDGHPADRVDDESISVGRADEDELIDGDGLGDVLEAVTPARADGNVGLEMVTGGVGNEHLSGVGVIGDPRGEIHRRAEPVLPAADRSACVDADTDPQRAVARAVVDDDALGKADRHVGLGDGDHHRVADRFDLIGVVRGQKRPDRRAELGRGVGGKLVAVGLGERGVAGEVCEEKGVLERLGSGHGVQVSPLAGRAANGHARRARSVTHQRVQPSGLRAGAAVGNSGEAADVAFGEDVADDVAA